MMSNVGASLPLPKLPLGMAIRLSYSWFFRKFVDVLRVSWLWMIICGGLVGCASWVQWSWMSTIMLTGIKTGDPALRMAVPAPPIWMMLPVNLAGLVVLLAAVSIAVAWHRRIILGEPPGLSGSNVVTKNVWRYIGTGILIGLTVIVPFAGILFPAAVVLLPPAQAGAPLAPAGIALLVLLMVSLYVAAIAVLLRLCMLLPARASGDVGLTFRRAWTRTRGNTWRLFWGLLACTLPPLIIPEIVVLIALPATGTLPSRASPAEMLDGSIALTMTVMSTVLSLVYLLILPIGVGFLSHAYRHFFGGGLTLIGPCEKADGLEKLQQ